MTEKDVKKAAALKYDAVHDASPQVVAKGRGKLAERIVAMARDHQVPMVEDRHLVQILEKLDLNTDIPTELYQAVAEVLVFVYRMNRPK